MAAVCPLHNWDEARITSKYTARLFRVPDRRATEHRDVLMPIPRQRLQPGRWRAVAVQQSVLLRGVCKTPRRR